MIETELKITLDAAGARAAAPAPGARRRCALAPRRTERAGLGLLRHRGPRRWRPAGIALRLRRVGRRWVQTIKRKAGGTAASGLFAHRENERPAPGGRLVLDGPDPDGALADVAAAAGGAPLAPVFETRVRAAASSGCAAPGGGEVELALDGGEIVAGEARAPIREAELELIGRRGRGGLRGGAAAVPAGPVRFAAPNKAARGYRLARRRAPSAPLAPRHAGDARLSTARRRSRRWRATCCATASRRSPTTWWWSPTATTTRGRTSCASGCGGCARRWRCSAPSLGEAAMAPLSRRGARPRAGGRAAARRRRADRRGGRAGGGARARRAGAGGAGSRRSRRGARRCGPRCARRSPGRRRSASCSTSARSSRARGWLAPSDYAQTERLATPIAEVAPAMLDKRHRQGAEARQAASADARRRGAARAAQGAEEAALRGRHARADLSGKQVAAYLKALKELQDSFGSLNDAAMARGVLTGPEAPAPADPAAQRGGRLGARHARGPGRRRPAAALRPLGAAARGGAVLGVKRARVPASDSCSTIQ